MARRGENIRKRKDGRWEGRYIKARTPEGKIQWGYVYGTAYVEVKRVLIQRKAEAGFYNLNRTDLTFEALAEVWLHSLRNSIKESPLCKTSIRSPAGPAYFYKTSVGSVWNQRDTEKGTHLLTDSRKSVSGVWIFHIRHLP